MVKNIKSLLSILVVLLVITNNVFSQTTESQASDQDTVTTATVNSAFENNTDYFSETPAANGAQNQYKAPSTAKMIIKMVVVLALVIAALYGIMLFFKKKNNPAQSDDDFLRRVSTLNLSPGKSVEIVTLVDRGFILGVTDSNINLIAEIDDKEMISALNLNFDKKQNIKKPMNFSDVLQMFMPGGLNKKNNIYQSSQQVVQNMDRTQEDQGQAGGDNAE